MIATMKFGSRLRFVKGSADSSVSWLLVPGGPGIESDYLVSMAAQLSIDVNLLTFDLPRFEHYSKNPNWSAVVESWRKDLCEAVRSQKNPVVVGHSFGGMLMLSTPELQKMCGGAIFLNSSPSRDWEKQSARAGAKIAATEAHKAEEEFQKKPSDEAFKKICVGWAPCYFLPEFEAKGREMLSQTGYNHFSYRAASEFLKDFQSQWSDWDFPTLCLAGESDLITPLSLFETHLSFAKKSNVAFANIKNCGHFPWIENPADFYLALRNFNKHFT